MLQIVLKGRETRNRFPVFFVMPFILSRIFVFTVFVVSVSFFVPITINNAHHEQEKTYASQTLAAVFFLLATLAMASSKYDDSELWEQVNKTPKNCLHRWCAERPETENTRPFQTGHPDRSHYRDVIKELFAR